MNSESKKTRWDRPIVLELEEMKSKIEIVLNEAFSKNIPCYFLVDYFDNITKQLREGASREILAAKASEESSKNENK